MHGLVYTSPECLSSDSVIIESTIGKLKGACSLIEADSIKKKLYKWTSIPYAEPPLGDNRFRRADPKNKVSDTLDATKVSNSCMQLINMKLSSNLEFSKPYELAKDSSSRISEDCLYLNIYAPANDDFMIKKKPIMVVIHGGDGPTGSGSLDINEPSVFVTTTDTIVVTFNYRLGIFGFLRLDDDDDIQGNQGFLDQHLALSWIHDNAEKFGGDNTKITLLGYGSGSRYVTLHLMYKPSFSLFRNVIIDSGSALNIADNLLSKNAAKKRTHGFIKTLNCGSNNEKNCLMKAKASDLALKSKKYLIDSMSKKSLLAASNIKSIFEPIVDGKVFSESPLKAFRTGNFKRCKLIVGFNANDGASEIPLNYGLTTDKKKQKKLKNGVTMRQVINFESFVMFIKKYYKFYPIYPMSRNLEKIHNTMIKEYTNHTIISTKPKQSNYFFQLRNLLNDEAYACSTFKLLDSVANKAEVFMYIYNHRMNTSKYPVWYGVVNGDELASVFGHPFKRNFNNRVSYSPWLETSNLKYSTEDKEISKTVMERWSAFVHGNNPNKRTFNPLWPVYKTRTRSRKLYLQFGQNKVKMMQLKKTKHCDMWNNIMPSIVYGN